MRRSIAVSAVVLATGGLVLFRTSGTSFAGPIGTHTNGTTATFVGPGLHGSVSVSQTAVLAGGDRDVYAEVKLSADPAVRGTDRAPFALAIALDTSGSMFGEKIEQAKRSVMELVRDMRDDDQIAVIRYSSGASIVQPLARVGDVRGTLATQVRQIEADGGTAIPLGMHAAMNALEEAGRGRVRRVVLVSDGLDSSRLESEHIAQDCFAHGVTISSLGIGLDFDESYMGAVAREGHGNFAFVKDGAALSAFLQRELHETATTTIEGAKVKLDLPAGLHFVSATGADARVLDEKSIELEFGALFARDERRAIVHLTARLDAGEEARLGANADWTQVLPSASVPFVPAHVEVSPLGIRGAIDPKTVDDSRDPLVFADATSVIASEREIEAANAYAAGDVSRAQSLIDKNVADLHAAQATAPAPIAAQLEKQVTVYDETKKSFHAAPGSGAGRAAAKRAFQNDWENLARTAY
ncbi:MAG TPA: VWA domain-containing protein [Polyangiaceae bacterium]